MKYSKAQLLLLLLIVWMLGLAAQPQILPPVEIGSDAVVKAPLIRKAVSFPTEVPPDSLPPLLPREIYVDHVPQPVPEGSIRPLYLETGLETTFGAWLRASYYPAGKVVPLLSFDSRMAVPALNRSHNLQRLHLQTRVSQVVNLGHNLSRNHSGSGSLNYTAWSYDASNHIRRLDWGAATLADLETRLSLEYLDQHALAKEHQGAKIGWQHSHNLHWRRLALATGFWQQDASYGLALQYLPAISWSPASDLRLGLLTDFRHLLPAVGIHHRQILKPDLYLEFSNRPTLRGTLRKELAAAHPWSALPERVRLTLVPLDASIQLFKSFGNGPDPSQLSLYMTSRFGYNEPLPAKYPDSEVTRVSYAELLQNQAGLGLRLPLWGWTLSQNLGLILEHLPDSGWRRRPYSPLLNARTSLGKTIGDAEVSIDLAQEYFSRGEYRSELPSVVDLGLSLQYPLSEELRLSLSLHNLFNTPYHQLGDQPAAGRSLHLALRYLPWR